MIFYFSGTGNSWSVAKHIAENLNEEIISISECINNKKFDFECKPNENIGFVYPIYACRSPQIVFDFIKNLNINNYKDNYVYCVDCSAGNSGAAEEVMYKALKDIKLNLNGSFNVLMPGNYIIAKSSLPIDECNRRLQNEEKECIKIAETIKNKKQIYTKKKNKLSYLFQSYIIGKYLFPLSIKYNKFFVNDKCTGCESCIRLCPAKALRKENNRIIRDGDKCMLCMKCINCCPRSAIEFGKPTIGKKRYKHPDYKGE